MGRPDKGKSKLLQTLHSEGGDLDRWRAPNFSISTLADPELRESLGPMRRPDFSIRTPKDFELRGWCLGLTGRP